MEKFGREGENMQNTLLEEIEDMERILQSGSATDSLRDRLQGYFD